MTFPSTHSQPSGRARDPFALIGKWARAFDRLRAGTWRWVARLLEAVQRRRDRIAVSQLLAWQDARLDDLGICHQDVVDALRERRLGPGTVLSRVRARRASRS